MPNALPAKGYCYEDLSESLVALSVRKRVSRRKVDLMVQNRCLTTTCSRQSRPQTLSSSTIRLLKHTMRFPWILFISGLCAKVHGGDVQQVLGSSLELSGTLYTCENGM